MKEIKLYSKNAKKHPDIQLKQIAKSLKEFGCRQPIVIDKNNEIIVGHGRWMAYQKYKDEYNLDKPKIERADDLTPQQVKAYRLADNKLNESDWDMDLAIEELKELDDNLFELTGFDKDLLIEPDDKDDEVPEVPDEPKSKMGDIYELGKHRIMAGDSTKREDVENLMDGKKADMVFTDPPYGVAYTGGQFYSGKPVKNKLEEIKNDKNLIYYNSLVNVIKYLDNGAFYIFYASMFSIEILEQLQKVGLEQRAIIIWKKLNTGFGDLNSHYKNNYEPIFYGVIKNKKANWQGDTKQITTWEFDKPKKNKLHPTMKPIALIEKAIINSSQRNDIVLDLFLGSGSTMIACEKTNRICYGMELDLKYIDVIIQRYEQFTGNKAKRVA